MILRLLLAFASVTSAFSGDRPKLSSISSQAEPAHSYGQIPLQFEANHGQFASEARFLSRGPGYHLRLTPSGAEMTLRRGQMQPAVLGLRLLGANSQAFISGQQELPGKVNCFYGNDPTRWRTNIPTFGQVKYASIYPGVDLVFYGNQNQLEYDFVLGPGVDPRVIRLCISGTRALEFDSEGNLVCQTDNGDLLQRAPYVYQEVNGVRKKVPGRYVLLAQKSVTAGCPQSAAWRDREIAPSSTALSHDYEIGFEIGAYDKSRPLIIDPVLNYSTYLGGSGSDAGYAIAVDAGGHAYITGYTDSPDFPGATPSTNFSDLFVAKLNPAGSALLYATYIGGNLYDNAYDIAVDALGNAYVTGQTSSTNFPTRNAFQPVKPGGDFYDDDAFVLKLNPTGSGLVYSTYLGGAQYEGAYGIAVDSAGHAYVTGLTSSTNFPVVNALQPNFGDALYYDAFVTKFAPSGSNLVFSTYLGGNSADSGDDIAVDSAGNIYVTGATWSTNFPTANAWQASLNSADFSESDVFLSKINSNGSALVFSTYLGGNGSEHGAALAVDPLGNVYVTGLTYSTNFPTVNALQPAMGSLTNSYGQYASDAFIAKFSSNGSTLVYSTYLGGSATDGGTGIAVDGNGRAYVAGSVATAQFPNPSTGDAFAVRLNPTGSALDDLVYLGGCGQEAAYGIALDPAGNAYLTGYTSSAGFPTVTPFQSALGGSFDAFVTKVRLNGPFTNQPPRVSLASSLPDGVARVNVPFELSATATDLGGRVTRVSFVQGTNVMATVTNGPYVVTIESLPIGEYNFTAIATDNQGASATSCPVSILVVPPPMNDDFEDRIPISGAPLTVTGSNRGASREPFEPLYQHYDAGRQTVWWSWTAPTNGSFTVSTEGSDFRTILAIYTGTNLATLNLVAGNTLGGSNGTSKLSLQAVAGMTYQIQVDSSVGSYGTKQSGNIVLSFTYNPPPPNDNFANRIPLVGLNVTTTGSNLGATKEPGEPDHLQSAPPPPGNTVWWTWTAPTNGTFTFSTDGSSFFPILAIYTGSSLTELTPIDARLLFDGTVIVLQALAGTVYQIVIDNYVSSSPGELMLAIRYQPPPLNDNFADRIVLAATYPLSWTGSNLGATRETNEPVHRLFWDTRQSVWWSWTAPTSGVFSIDTAGSSFEPVLAIYTGEDLLSLTRVAPPPNPPFPPRMQESDPAQADSLPDTPSVTAPVFPAPSIRLFFEAVAGTASQIVVDNYYYAQGGDIMLALAYHPPPPNDHFANRIALNGSSLTTTGSNLGATRQMGEPSHLGYWPYADSASIWWSWTPPTNGWYTMSTDGSNFDTLLAVYTGTTLSNLVLVARNTGAGATNGGSKITAYFVAGTPCLIVVASAADTRGDAQLRIRPANRPANDDFANRITLAGLPLSFSGSNVDATKEPGEPNPDSASGGASIWWTFIAPTSGVFKLTAETTAFAPVIGVYTGTVLSNLTEIVSRRALFSVPGSPALNTVRFRAQAGMAYHIVIDSSVGKVGDVDLTLEEVMAPPNDDFANRIPILGNSVTVSGSNSNATHEIGEPSYFYSTAEASVWWSWTAGGDAQVTLSAAGDNLYLVLAVYTGSTLSNLTFIAGDAFGGTNGASLLTFQASAGQTYQIAVDGAFGSLGDFVLNLEATGPPFNDLFANSIALSGAPVTTMGHNIGATVEPFEPWHGDVFGGASVWWSWTAPSNGLITVTTEGSQFETLLAVYTGLAVSNLTSVGQRLDPGTVLVQVNEGATYRIAVDGNNGATGQILLRIDYTPPPPNDQFADRIVLSGISILTQGSNLAATKEPGEPDHGGDAGGASVWWSWTAPATGRCLVATPERDFLIGIYTGAASVSNLVTIVGGQSLVEFDAVGGQTYHLAIDGYAGIMGSITLSLELRPLPSNDFFANRTTLYGQAVGVTANNIDATREPGEPYNPDFYGERSLWWSWTPPFSANFTLSVETTNFESLLSIYTGSLVSSLTLIAESASGGAVNQLSFGVVAGKTYQIAVDSYLGAGNFALNISPTPPPANDDFANRIQIPPLTFSLTASTVNATKETAEPNHAGIPGGKSVWWRWTAPFSGPARISTSGSDFDTLLGVYTGAAFSSLNLIASDDDSGGNSASLVQFQAVAGTTYQIAVDGFGGASGFVVLNLIVEPAVKLTPLGISNGRFQFRVTGPVERQINVERSDNLSDWTAIWSVWMTDYTTDLEDPWSNGATNFFYRAWREP